MATTFLLYGATGYVGKEMARRAVERGLKPILAARNEAKLKPLADELGLEYRVFDLSERDKLNAALAEVSVVLHCAGPYIDTYQPMVEACFRTGVHYLDITGEIPVFQALADLDSPAKEKGVMLLPAVGFDVVPTDCLALYLKEKLPTATHLTLGFYSQGPAGLPPGTMKTGVTLIPFGDRIRRNGQLVKPEKGIRTRNIDFGGGEVETTRFTWGDVFTAYYTTGIPNIEVFVKLRESMAKQMKTIDFLRPLLSLSFVQKYLKGKVRGGASAEKREQTRVSVWGEVKDSEGRTVSARLHGPEAGVEWTTLAALAAVERVMKGEVKTGFQTPAQVFGADFVLDCEGVIREDVVN